jgi:GT2 family glycosyltransferase
MDVSVIIVNYNTVGLLINSIDSVFTHTSGISYEIIIVDNASVDNSASILQEKFGLNIQYIGLDKNIGFGKANNVGIKKAKGRNNFPP